MDLGFLYPKKGEDVETWWGKVIDWAKSLEVEIGPGMLASQGLNGLRILGKNDTPVRTPFKVRLSGRRASISAGFLDNRAPFIVAGSAVVRLDGTGRDGITPDPLGRPVLDLRQAKPGSDGRSAIALRVMMDSRGIPLDETETPEALQVVHVSEFSPVEKRRLMVEESVGIQELAVVYWDDEQPDGVAQIVRHNLKHSFAPSDGTGGVGRPFFSAV